MCNSLFHCITGRSARYTFKPTDKTSASGEIAGEENEGTAMTMTESVKKTVPKAEEEGVEQGTVMINEGAEDNEADEGGTEADKAKDEDSD